MEQNVLYAIFKNLRDDENLDLNKLIAMDLH